MSKPRKKKRPLKRVLALPDLEQSKAAVLNTFTSKSGRRSYDLDRRFCRLVPFRTAPRIQPQRGSEIPDLSRTEAICSHHQQSPLGCRPAQSAGSLLRYSEHSCDPKYRHRQPTAATITHAKRPPRQRLSFKRRSVYKSKLTVLWASRVCAPDGPKRRSGFVPVTSRADATLRA